MPILGLAPSDKPVRPAHFDIEGVIRPNILALKPYRCARDDYQSGVLLDANENALGPVLTRSSAASLPDEVRATLDLNLHRYPDPSHPEIKTRLAELRGLPGPDHVFLGVGSDEVIDLLIRVCVAPERERILTTPPTYGMYAVCAQVNDVGITRVPLELTGQAGEGGEEGRFSVNVNGIKEAVKADPSIKLIFLCSPGNPTGTLIPLSVVRSILDYESFKGIVVVDEAYIDFAAEEASTATLIQEYANVVVMQTLSKSFGLAAIRLGIALAQPPLIQILSNTKAPYNISTPTAALALNALSPESISLMREKAQTLVAERAKLLSALAQPKITSLGVGPSIGGNDANFVLVPILARPASLGADRDSDGAAVVNGSATPAEGRPDNVRSQAVYTALAETEGVVVRFRGQEPGCDGCIRITVGTPEENELVVKKLAEVLTRI